MPAASIIRFTKRRKERVVFLLIIILAIFFRFYRLGTLPPGFLPEEVSNGWNAYSLLKTGRDEWGVFLPLVFRETGGYKLALNSYLIVPSLFIFGVNELAVRIPAALASVLSVVLTYFLVIHVFKNKKYALAAAFLLAVTPWHIAVGRYGEEVNLGVPLFLSGLILFLKGLRTPKLLIVSAVCFGLTYYVYFSYVGFTSLFLFGLFWIYRKVLWSQELRRYVLVFGIIMVICILPYITNPALKVRFSQTTSVSTTGLVNRINEHRGACERVYPTFLCRVLYNKGIDRAYEFFKNYTSHYSTGTFFVRGAEYGLSSMPEGWGFLHLHDFIFIAFGMVVLLHRRLFPGVFVLWLSAFSIPSALVDDGHIWRMFPLLPLPQIVAGVGLVEFLRKMKWSIFNFGMIALIVVSVSKFWVDYTAYFPLFQAMRGYFGFREVYATLGPIEETYDRIYIAPTNLKFDQTYIYYVFYLRPDPRILQNGDDVERITNDDGWVRITRIGKWNFIDDIRSVFDTFSERSLVVTDGAFDDKMVLTSKDKRIFIPTLLHTVTAPDGAPAFKIFEYAKK
ncbi:glycosyltransferase family 39 protein [Candidatus Gottesmanbacteria bacterium]|nr:glycosyltransferase family 39 protein [Candidatus Gottesmanbacteria bacterium]